MQQRGRDDDLAPHALGIGTEEFGGERLLIQLEKIEKLPDAGPRLILMNAVQSTDHEKKLQTGEGLIHRARVRHEAK